MTAYERVKCAVDIADAARRYGIQLDRHGKTHCPFHAERTASFSISRELQMYHCFGCGLSGDVIDLVQRLEGMRTAYEAVRKLNDDYHIGAEIGGNTDAGAVKKHRRDAGLVKAFNEWEQTASNIWGAYCRTLERWKRELKPRAPDEPYDLRYIRACLELDYADYIYHEVFINGSFEDKVEFYKTHAKEVKRIDDDIRKGGVA